MFLVEAMCVHLHNINVANFGCQALMNLAINADNQARITPLSLRVVFILRVVARSCVVPSPTWPEVSVKCIF